MKKCFAFLAVSLSLVTCTSQSTDLSFNEDIAPIIHENCSPCHRPGGAAPFSLLTYQQVNRKRNTIVDVTKSGYMPPWPADTSYSHFIGEKGLTLEEVEKIRKWVEAGAHEGDGGDTLALPQFSEMSRIGVPDTTIWFDSLLIEGDSKDKFYLASTPLHLPSSKHIRAMEFLPNSNNLVHHMNGRILLYPNGTKSNLDKGERLLNLEVSKEEYLRQFLAMNLANDDGSRPPQINSAVNYLPGVEATIYPEGIGGFTLPRKSMLLADDIHYGPISQEAWDHSRVNIFYANKKPERPINEVMIGTNGEGKIIPPLVIPPNEVTEHTAFLNIPEDISILTINPHMHLLGKSFKSYAVTASGDTIPLIHIPEWDFRWQYFYTFPSMVKIPKGSTIFVEASFDNTARNPNNPNNPSIEVRERTDLQGAGMRTTDEMLQFIITWLPYKKGDEHISLSAGN